MGAEVAAEGAWDSGNGRPSVAALEAAIEGLRRKGFGRLLVSGQAVAFDEIDAASLPGPAVLQVVVDRLQTGNADTRQRLTDSIENGYRAGPWRAYACCVYRGSAA